MLRTADKRLFLGRPLKGVVPRYKRANPGTADQVNVSGSGSTNTKSTWQDVIASCAIDADGFYLTFRNGAVADFLIDVGIGGTGDAVDATLVSNLLASIGSGGAGSPIECYIPLPIAAGTRVAARFQSTDASQTASISIRPVAGGHYRTIRCSRATTYGANTADSGGVQVDPGGSANTYGSYSQITASTTNPIKQALICVGSQNNGAIGATHTQTVDIGSGAALSEVVEVGTLRLVADTTADCYFPVWRNVFMEIPAGTRLAARSQDNQTDATDRLWDCVIVGFD